MNNQLELFQILSTPSTITNRSYCITEEIPKEGEYGINPLAPDKKPRLVVRFSDDNDTLGMRLESPSWFEWMPLASHHRKVVFSNYR